MKILIYADNGKGVGLGHLTRCISLAHKLVEFNHNTLLIVNEDRSYNLKNKFSKLKIEQIKFSEKKICNIKKEFKPDLFIIDSYKFKEAFISKIKKNVLIAGFDDFSELDLLFDIIINGIPGAENKNYCKSKFLLLGEKYQIIKQDLLEKKRYQVKKQVKNLIILTGGDDNKNITPCD